MKGKMALFILFVLVTIPVAVSSCRPGYNIFGKPKGLKVVDENGLIIELPDTVITSYDWPRDEGNPDNVGIFMLNVSAWFSNGTICNDPDAYDGSEETEIRIVYYTRGDVWIFVEAYGMVNNRVVIFNGCAPEQIVYPCPCEKEVLWDTDNASLANVTLHLVNFNGTIIVEQFGFVEYEPWNLTVSVWRPVGVVGIPELPGGDSDNGGGNSGITAVEQQQTINATAAAITVWSILGAIGLVLFRRWGS